MEVGERGAHGKGAWGPEEDVGDGDGGNTSKLCLLVRD